MSNLDEIVKKISKIHEQAHRKIVDFNLYNQRVMISCSGGPDSTLLLRVFYNIAQEKKNFLPKVFHINYQLRHHQSQADQLFVEQMCRQWGFPLEVYTVQPSDELLKKGRSIQEWARLLRQRFYQKWAAKGGVIVLGHHYDDLAETILMRLARGVGPASFWPFSSWQPPFWRPLLDLKKDEILSYLNDHNWPYRTDASNFSLKYDRNFIRHQVFPALKSRYTQADEKMINLAYQVNELANWALQELKARYPCASSLPFTAFYELPKPIFLLLLQDFIQAQVRECSHRKTAVSFHQRLVEDLYQGCRQLAYRAQSLGLQQRWSYDLSAHLRLVVSCEQGVHVEQKPVISGLKQARLRQYEGYLQGILPYRAFLAPFVRLDLGFSHDQNETLKCLTGNFCWVNVNEKTL